jgi:protein tyrosine/serine phosphatase
MTKPAFKKILWPSSLKMLAILLLLLTIPACSDPALVASGLDLPLNFHEIDSGKAYRSAQPSGDELSNVISLVDIKTVINLRGAHPGDSWYDNESSVCQQNGVTLVSFPMSGGTLPDPEMMKGIIDTLKTATYPILIHCQGGADRSGAVSAIYLMLIAGEEKSVALKQLSIRYLHLRSKYPWMDYLAEIYEPTDEWLAAYPQNYDQLLADGPK